MYEQTDQRNRIVVHYKDGTVLRGFTHDFTPVKDVFHLTQAGKIDEQGVLSINCAELKAIFFVKDLEGNKDYVEKTNFDEVDATSVRGLKIKVEFNDGEVMRGVSLGYNKNRQGFFITPVDNQCNNERIFIFADATRDIVIGELAAK